MAAYLRKEAPGIDIDAVAGKGSEERDEEILETFIMLGIARDVPLLIDDGFTVSRALSTEDVPDLASSTERAPSSCRRSRISARLFALPEGRVTAAEVIRRVAAGIHVPHHRADAQYYPATELQGRCAPPFSLKSSTATNSTPSRGSRRRDGQPW